MHLMSFLGETIMEIVWQLDLSCFLHENPKTNFTIRPP